MTFPLVMKVLGVVLILSGIASASAEWGPGRPRHAWQRQRVRRPSSVTHFVFNWAIGFITLSLLALFVIWYLGPRR